MIRKLVFSCFALILCMVSGSVAQAEPVTITQGQSATFTYQSTQYPNARATATVTLNGNQLTVNFQNTSTPNATAVGPFLSALGFNTTPNLNVTSATFSGAASNWQFSTGGGGIGNYELVLSGQGAGRRLAPGESGTAVLMFSNVLSSITIDATIAHLTSLGANGEDSDKPFGVTNPPGPQPIPEPATMFLLGTGLTGLAAKFRKRRREASSTADETDCNV